jgi:WD40 repeat protein/mono/diheme cytochrome c family protein
MTLARPLALAGLLAIACLPARAADKPGDKPAEPAEVSYYKDVRPIFQQHCLGCHQPAKPSGSYVMTGHADLLKKGESDHPGVVPGKPEASHLVTQVLPREGGKKPAMPRGQDPLSPRDVALIKKWIAQGAKDDTPMSDRAVVDMDHPPSYVLPPVITALAYSRDGQLLAVAGYHEILLHKADGSGLVARLVGMAERVQSLAFSADGKLLAMAGGSPGRFGEVQVWDHEKKKLKLSQPVSFDTLYGVSWSHDGEKIAFGCADNTVRAIDLTGKQVLFNGAHNDWVLGTTFSTDSSYLVSVGRDMTAKLTEVSTQRFIDNITSITPGALKGGLSAVALRPVKEKRMVKAKDISIADTREKVYDELLFGGSDGTPRLYKMHRETKRVIGDDANKVREYEPMPGRLYGVAFSPDGKHFAAASSLEGSGEVRVYAADNPKPVSKFAGQKGGVYAVAYSPDGKTVASAGFDGVVRLNEAMTGKLIKEFIPVPGLASAAAGK